MFFARELENIACLSQDILKGIKDLKENDIVYFSLGATQDQEFIPPNLFNEAGEHRQVVGFCFNKDSSILHKVLPQDKSKANFSVNAYKVDIASIPQRWLEAWFRKLAEKKVVTVVYDGVGMYSLCFNFIQAERAGLQKNPDFQCIHAAVEQPALIDSRKFDFYGSITDDNKIKHDFLPVVMGNQSPVTRDEFCARCELICKYDKNLAGLERTHFSSIFESIIAGGNREAFFELPVDQLFQLDKVLRIADKPSEHVIHNLWCVNKVLELTRGIMEGESKESDSAPPPMSP
ncbi:Uncharacterised protein [Legionella steigerwaltii]|uniref:Uncharacterized protein n=1 Tax=Legionella steigerwaltii TaxID=460 RepID=A0A378LDR5_9GAMM|nr:hypothetical protein [Legionella steigerwaltii]KTD70278.1 hypothetical protein Lstg_3280 [Legionella steigerwaltii]STY24012.1 Uncharacterised protein [Legionella steigerwaltii]